MNKNGFVCVSVDEISTGAKVNYVNPKYIVSFYLKDDMLIVHMTNGEKYKIKQGGRRAFEILTLT